jgi:hypothetical protein
MKNNPKIHMEAHTHTHKCTHTHTHKSPSNQAILSKKNNVGSITTFDYKLNYRAIVQKTALEVHKNRHISKLTWIKDLEISPSSYSHLICDKSGKNITKRDPCFSPCMKINSKWIKGLNVKHELWNYYRKQGNT